MSSVNTSFDKAKKVEVGLKYFFEPISNDWELTKVQQRQLLGSPDIALFQEWKCNYKSQLSTDTLHRLSYLVRLHIILNNYFKKTTVLEWLNNINSAPIFQGVSPLEYMCGGDLDVFVRVARYLVNPESGRDR